MYRLDFKRWTSIFIKVYQTNAKSRYCQNLMRSDKTASSCIRRILVGCEKCKLIEKCKLKGNKKIKCFEITPKGVKVAKELLDLKQYCKTDGKGNWYIHENVDLEDTGNAPDKS
jgi:hypothetical protein